MSLIKMMNIISINNDLVDFELSELVLLLFGIFFGVILTFVIYILLMLKSLKPKQYIVKSRTKGLTEAEIDEKIKFAQDIFLDKDLKGELSDVAHCKDVCASLVFDIASVYFPKSKRPLMELSIDELLMLSVYISNRINELLDRKGLRLLKKLKLSSLVGMGDVKKVIDDSSLMKATKKYKFIEAYKTVAGALNVVNPLYWAKKLMLNRTLNFAVSKVCLMVIAITAEETYKIYSKNVFNKEVTIVDKYKDLANEIEGDLSDFSVEEIDAYEEDSYGQEEDN
ncbi:MAG: hypothetical protein R3Y60_01465 [bacterium]